MPRKRFLVTGATGFIGSRLASLLVAAGASVVAGGEVTSELHEHRRRWLLADGIQFSEGSVTDPGWCREAVQDCTHVIHLAAIQHEMNVPRSRFFEVNVDGTTRLLEAAAEAGVSRFVFGSTIGVYGEGGRTVLDENSPLHPLNDYGASKVEAEKVVRDWGSRVPVSIARISETYGPGDHRLLKLFRAVEAGRFVMVGKGDNLKQLVYVDDLAQGLVAAAEHPSAAGETFLLAGNETLTTRQMVAEIARALGRSPAFSSVPMWPLLVAAVALESTLRPLGIQPPLHRRRLDFFRKSFVVSNGRARALLGFEPKVSFREGAERTARWYREQGLI